MKEKIANRTRVIRLRLTLDEYSILNKKWKQSTCRAMSDYVRRSVFEKPIVTTFRNQSLDDFMTEMAQLRTELNHIGNNWNQSVKRLHTLNQIGEFKTWLLTYEIEKKTLINKIDEIKSHIRKIAEKWLQ
jgi:hypothetical protein